MFRPQEIWPPVVVKEFETLVSNYWFDMYTGISIHSLVVRVRFSYCLSERYRVWALHLKSALYIPNYLTHLIPRIKWSTTSSEVGIIYCLYKITASYSQASVLSLHVRLYIYHCFNNV